MRRFVFLFIIFSGILSFAVACNKAEDVPKIETEIYFTDARMDRLLPFKYEIIDADKEHQAMAVLRILSEGRGEDDDVRPVIPEGGDWLSVRVSGDIAYVDIDSQIKKEMGYGPHEEELFIYQIVNSLTSIKGIRFVKFTIDGIIHKDFMGFYDMRDTFKLKYPE